MRYGDFVRLHGARLPECAKVVGTYPTGHVALAWPRSQSTAAGRKGDTAVIVYGGDRDLEVWRGPSPLDGWDPWVAIRRTPWADGVLWPTVGSRLERPGRTAKTARSRPAVVVATMPSGHLILAAPKCDGPANILARETVMWATLDDRLVECAEWPYPEEWEPWPGFQKEAKR